MYNLTDRHIVLGVTGSIAIYKACDLASKLTQAGAVVDVAMTPESRKFVSAITFQSVTGRRAYSDIWDEASDISELHVALARRADLMIIAPATATLMARLAHGLAEEIVSLTALATRAPVLLAPAMDPQMWEHPATVANVETLRARGVAFVGPEEGRLASGQMGLGRMSEVDTIIGAARQSLGRAGDLAGRKVVVSAGGTHEAIDPVRFVGNESSGKMGFAVAEAARDRGADVLLVSGPVALTDPYGVRVVRVKSAAQMRDVIVPECQDADVLVMAAAVADYQPAEPVGQKIKREGRDGLDLPLARTPDILSEVGRPSGMVKVGFAAESQDLLENAAAKIAAKDLDLIVANDITAPDAGFAVDTNRVTILDRGGNAEEMPLQSKYEVACRILDRAIALTEEKP
jgi:phosphopantothenoylcysteine decarboxylase/phosphopantothenate--cysteine ligase